MRLSNVFSNKLPFSKIFLPENYAFHSRHFKVLLKEVHEHANDS